MEEPLQACKTERENVRALHMEGHVLPSCVKLREGPIDVNSSTKPSLPWDCMELGGLLHL
jgi:hypothetical protein